MKTNSILFTVVMMAAAAMAEKSPSPIVIAHRGASGYLPEHTLAGTALAFGMGADFIEQDVVLTKDDIPIVLHDIHLDTVTDVAVKYADRHREDGRFYAIDFSLAEIKSLRVRERVDLETGERVFAGRFPLDRSDFQVPTLKEAIEMIQGLNQSSDRSVGIYPEIKKPRWHRTQGKEISRITLSILNEYGYRTKDDPIFLQCFDPDELRRIRDELKCELRLVQLIGSNAWKESDADYAKMVTEEGIHKVAQYADGIGPWMPWVISDSSQRGDIRMTNLVELAHAHELVVHPFTFRRDALPDYVDSMESLLQIFVHRAGVDGFFTDFPDQVERHR